MPSNGDAVQQQDRQMARLASFGRSQNSLFFLGDSLSMWHILVSVLYFKFVDLIASIIVVILVN